MSNKFLRFITVEPKCWLRLAILAVMVVAIIGQLWYKGVQAKQINTIQKKVDLAMSIPAIEKELKTKAQLEAFRNEGSGEANQVQFSKISGIAMQGGKPSVLIDDTVYGEGDTFGEYVIVDISEQVIILENKKTNARKNLYVFE